jgi:hypothetical protein
MLLLFSNAVEDPGTPGDNSASGFVAVTVAVVVSVSM